MNLIISNWKVGHLLNNYGQSGLFVCLTNGNLHIKVPNENLVSFGYHCNGAELGVTGHYRTDNIPEQIEVLLHILSLELNRQTREPKWYKIKQFLNTYEGKKRLGKIIAAPKNLKNSIKTVVAVVDEEYQSICRIVD